MKSGNYTQPILIWLDDHAEFEVYVEGRKIDTVATHEEATNMLRAAVLEISGKPVVSLKSTLDTRRPL